VSLRQLIDFLARYKLGDPPLTTLMIHPVQFWGLSVTAMPERVQIGPYTYPVVCDEREHIKYEHGKRVLIWGAMQYIEHRILIDPNMSPQKSAVTLLHEVNARLRRPRG